MDKERLIMNRIIHLSTSVRRAIFTPSISSRYPIGRKQLSALTSLSEKGMMNMTQLARQIDVSNQQLTKIVDVLVGKNMVERRYDPNNRRVVLVDLSEKGKEYIENMTSAVMESLKERGFTISKAQLKALDEHLTYIEKFLADITN
ncbi:MAG TPA: MarR family transcriptional regulator [Tissierellia bacterium]|jgi:DNA-binding MarR family transcriptional regulator|nr:MarR family transcriptional regulator [Tissierellia bacterium]